MQQFLRKNLSSILLLVALGILVFNPNAKAFLLKALLGTGILNASTAKEAAGNNAGAADNLTFTDKNAVSINTAGLRGKVVFINFWATWCPPCIAEMGTINALYKKLKTDPRFVFIMVDADSNLPTAVSFMTKHQYDLPVYQFTGPVSADLYSGSLPTTLIIDSKGMLVQKHEGIANYDTKEMLAFLKSL